MAVTIEKRHEERGTTQIPAAAAARGMYGNVLIT